MANAAVATAGAPTRSVRYGSISQSRRWALRWSSFCLTLFAIFFLMPPFYLLIPAL
jgi:multiple sugar transport system permease protein